MEIVGKFDKSVSLLSWAYNEEDSILEYLERATFLLDSVAGDYEIVLIDDGSVDNTFKIAKDFQKRNPRLRILQNEKNLSVGVSCQRAIAAASKDFIFWQTVDWSYDISDLRRHLEYLKTYDIVQGVRRKPVEIRIGLLKPFLTFLQLFGVKYLTRRSDTVRKALVSVINYIVIRILFNVPISDFQNVTFYPRQWIQSVKYNAKSSFINPEGLIRSYWSGKTIKEVPINFIPREKGLPKGASFRSISGAVKDILRAWFLWIVLGQRGMVQKGKVYRLGL